MPFNLLLLPLLGGYVFVRCWNFTKFYIIRSTNERLLIASSLAGIALLVASYAVHILSANLFPCSEWSFCIPTLWDKWIPIEYSGVSFGAFMIGLTACHFFNLFCSEEKQIDRVINRDAEPLELLLRRAQVEEAPVSITLESGKIYVGRVAHQFNPGTVTNYISLLPLKSGHRDPHTQAMVLDLNYQKTYTNIKREADKVIDEVIRLEMDGENLPRARDLVKKWLELQNVSNRFVLVLPIKQIISANLFDSTHHDEYFETEQISN
jgi:hypothetical protein